MSNKNSLAVYEFTDTELEQANARNVVEMKDENGTYYEIQDGFGNQLHVVNDKAKAERFVKEGWL